MWIPALHNYVLRNECLCPHQIHMLKPSHWKPNDMVLGSGVLRVKSPYGISALRRIDSYKSFLSGSYEDTVKSSLQARKRTLTKNQICQYIDIKLCSLQNVSNKYLMFKKPSLWYFIVEAWAYEYTVWSLEYNLIILIFSFLICIMEIELMLAIIFVMKVPMPNTTKPVLNQY